jgi:7-keto-8-aminopelargonate synthetase-like enzyme
MFTKGIFGQINREPTVTTTSLRLRNCTDVAMTGPDRYCCEVLHEFSYIILSTIPP